MNEVHRVLECARKNENPFEGEVTHVDENYVPDAWVEARANSLMGQVNACVRTNFNLYL